MEQSAFLSLPRELRDAIYESLLADVGTLFLGLLAPAIDPGAKNTHEEGKTEKDNDGKNNTMSDALPTLVDIRLQQQLNPLPLLHVSPAIRDEFLNAMTRRANRQKAYYFTISSTPTSRPTGSSSIAPTIRVQSLRPSTAMSWSGFSDLIDAFCVIMDWKMHQGLRLEGITFRYPEGNNRRVVWTCRGLEDAEVSLNFYLHVENVCGPIQRYTLFVRRHGLWVRWTLIKATSCGAGRSRLDFFLAGSGVKNTCKYIACQHDISATTRMDNLRLVSPGHLLVEVIRRHFGRLDGGEGVKFADLEPHSDGMDLETWLGQIIARSDAGTREKMRAWLLQSMSPTG